MQLQTRIDIPKASRPIDYTHQILLLGSCFAENIGSHLTANKFNADINPFGTLYNPFSVLRSLELLLEGKQFTEADLFEHNGLFHSFSHHSRFSSSSADECLATINSRMSLSASALLHCNTLIITFGSAYIYTLKETGDVVSNCHKLPDSLFDRRRADVGEIADRWSSLLNRLHGVNPHLQIIFTVSPIRHWKDGAHENQLSKSVLLLAIDELISRHSFCSYFPAFELMMDELRDYRFYAEDMIHPSAQAIGYIWERFCETMLSTQTIATMSEWQKIHKALSHKPFNPHSATHKKFLEQNLAKLEHFSKNSPYFACTNEIALIREQLQAIDLK